MRRILESARAAFSSFVVALLLAPGIEISVTSAPDDPMSVPLCGVGIYPRESLATPSFAAASKAGEFGVSSTGLRRLLLMRVMFPDEAVPAIDESEARELLATTTAWYRAHSYSSLSITSDVTPALLLPQAKSWYAGQPPSQLMLHARAAAAGAGYADAAYDLDAVRFSVIANWNFLGLAATGSKGVWLQSSSAGVLIHELGHSFGLEHADAWVAADDSILGPGTKVSYGNPFDTMGLPHGDPSVCHFNVGWKQRLHWLPDTSISVVTTSGTVRLAAFDVPALASGSSYGIKVRKDEWQDYTVEFRQAIPANPWCANGVLVNWTPRTAAGDGTFLLDTTPGTPSANAGFADAALAVGKTLSDFRAGVHVTPLATGTSGNEKWIDIRVNLGSFAGNKAPVLMLAATETNIVPGQVIQLSAAAVDPDGDAIAFSWELGDATIGPNAGQMAKSWPVAGRYVVQCTVSDMKGGTTARQLLVTVGGGTSTGRIVEGLVHDSNGTPVAGARVYDGLSVENYRGALTDVDGHYVLTGLADGPLTLEAVRRGYQFQPEGWSRPFDVSGDVAGVNWVGTPLPQVEVLAIDSRVVEGRSPAEEGRFEIRRNGPSDSRLMVRLRLSGSALPGIDYTVRPPGPAQFNLALEPGVPATNVIVSPLPDALTEPSEEIVLTVLDDVSYVVGPSSRAVIPIDDPDSQENSPPVAGTDRVIRHATDAFTAIALAALLANDTDSDGDSLSFWAADTVSVQGAEILRLGDALYYLPPLDLTGNDSFGYTILDSRGLAATGTVQVVTEEVPAPELRLSRGGSGRVIEGGNGVSGFRFRLEFTEEIAVAPWRTLAHLTNDASGQFRFTDIAVESAPAGFYRVVSP